MYLGIKWQKTAFSLIKSWLALGSPVFCSSLFQNCLVHKKIVVDSVQVIKAKGKTPLPYKTRPDCTRLDTPDQTNQDQTNRYLAKIDQTRPK